MTSSSHTRIAILAAHAAEARIDLADALRAACSGPHDYVQHRDRQGPWCDMCGYAQDGTRVKERR